MYSYMYVVALCVCLLQICQLTCVPVEEARRVLQAYCYQAHHHMYCLLITLFCMFLNTTDVDMVGGARAGLCKTEMCVCTYCTCIMLVAMYHT